MHYKEVNDRKVKVVVEIIQCSFDTYMRGCPAASRGKPVSMLTIHVPDSKPSREVQNIKLAYCLFVKDNHVI